MVAGTARPGSPRDPRSCPTPCCARLEEHPGHHPHPGKLLVHPFWPATHKTERFGLPSRCVYFCPRIFWPSCSSTTGKRTYDLSTQGSSISPSAASGLSSEPTFKQHDHFRAHTQLFIVPPANNLQQSAARRGTGVRQSDGMDLTPPKGRKRSSFGLPHLLSGGAASTVQLLLPTRSTGKAYVTSQKSWHFQTSFFLFAFCFLIH